MNTIINKLLSTLLIACSLGLFAQAHAKTLKVGIVRHVPFAMKIKTEPTGLAVDIWKAVANKLKWPYIFVPMPSDMDKGFMALKKGDIDVLIGAIPVDERGLAFAKFSRPFYVNKIGIVIHNTQKTFWQYFRLILSALDSFALLSLLFVFILFSHIIWLLERGDTVPQGYAKGVCVALWFSLASFLHKEHYIETFSKEHPPKGLSHYASRVMLFFWYSVSGVILAAFIATITASLTLSLSTNDNKTTLEQIKKQQVAMRKDVSNIISEKFIYPPIIVSSYKKAIQLLIDHKVYGVVENFPTAKYHLYSKPNNDLILSDLVLGYSEYAFAFHKHTTHQRRFDRAFEQLKSEKVISNICAQYRYIDKLICAL